MKRRIVNDEEAVSPVIAVILMVAITVVMAAVLYAWVSGWGLQPKNSPTGSMMASEDGAGIWDVQIIKMNPQKINILANLPMHSVLRLLWK